MQEHEPLLRAVLAHVAMLIRLHAAQGTGGGLRAVSWG